MNIQRPIEVILIIMSSYLYIVKSEHFIQDAESLNVVQEQALNLDCIRVELFNMDPFIFSFILNMRIPLVISNRFSSDKQVQAYLCPNIVMQLYSTENLQQIFNNCITHNGIIFIILFSQKIDWHYITTLSRHHWKKYKIYRVFYITTENVKFYHPFVTRNKKYGAMVDAKDYNIKDLFKNLYGYPMRVFIFDSVFSQVEAERDILNVTKVIGVDANVAYLLEDKLNFTMQLQWPHEDYFGSRLDNGSFNGALGRMVRQEIDITMTGFFIKDYLTRDVHFSVPVYMDKLCCYVIKSRRIPQALLPLYAVDENFWIVYLSIGLFSSFAWILIRRANLYISRFDLEISNSSLESYIHYLTIFTNTWALWLRMTVARFPSNNAERIFAISLCLVSVIIGALFESSLATVFIHPHYYKDINTLEELEQANLKVFIKHEAMRDDLFRGQNSRLYNSLDERVVLVGEPEERLINMMSKRGGFAVVTREFSLLTLDIYYYVTHKINVIPECPKTYHLAYLYTKNSPYEEAFNMVLLKFLAAGLIDQWITESIHKAQCQMHNFDDFVTENSHQWKAFQINDLQLAFQALICGNICAFLLFLAEFIINRKLLRKIK